MKVKPMLSASRLWKTTVKYDEMQIDVKTVKFIFKGEVIGTIDLDLRVDLIHGDVINIKDLNGKLLVKVEQI